jgi:hypothetical protein
MLNEEMHIIFNSSETKAFVLMKNHVVRGGGERVASCCSLIETEEKKGYLFMWVRDD